MKTNHTTSQSSTTLPSPASPGSVAQLQQHNRALPSVRAQGGSIIEGAGVGGLGGAGVHTREPDRADVTDEEHRGFVNGEIGRVNSLVVVLGAFEDNRGGAEAASGQIPGGGEGRAQEGGTWAGGRGWGESWREGARQHAYGTEGYVAGSSATAWPVRKLNARCAEYKTGGPHPRSGKAGRPLSPQPR